MIYSNYSFLICCLIGISVPSLSDATRPIAREQITLNPTDINQIAGEITVRIEGPRGGSGVIVEKQGNIYYVLTNWHVVNRAGEYEIVTSDGARHRVYYSLVRQIEEIDLAVIPFESPQSYPVATVADASTIEMGSSVYVGGWPRSGSNIGQRLFLTTAGTLTRRQPPRGGYTLVYTNLVRSGMSGGPILNEVGNLIGINGLVQLGINRDQIVSAGIEINRFLEWRKTATLPTVPQRSLAANAPNSNSTASPNQPPQPSNSAQTVADGGFIVAQSIRDDSGEIMALKLVSADVVSGSSNGAVALWNLETGGLRRTFLAHQGGVNGLTVSPDGELLVTGGEDGTVKLWNFATGLASGEFPLLHRLQGHANAVLSVAITPNAQKIISGSWDNTIKIWDVNTGELLQTLSGHDQVVSALAVSPDGQILASGSRDQTVKLWNLATGDLIRTLNGHSLGILSLAISPDGEFIASGSADSTIAIWRLNSGQPVRRLRGHGDGVWSVEISSEGTLVSGSWDTTVKLWNINTGELLASLQAHPSYVNAVTISPDGNTIVSGGWEAQVKIWRRN